MPIVTGEGPSEVEGFCFATIFVDYEPGGYGAFAELTEELKRAEARHIVVPSLDHVSSHPLLRHQMVDQLEHDAGARMWAVTRRRAF